MAITRCPGRRPPHHWTVLESILRIIVDWSKEFASIGAFAIGPDVLFLVAGRAQTVEAVHDGLGAQVAVFEVVARPEAHVQVRAVDVVGCLDIAHDCGSTSGRRG